MNANRILTGTCQGCGKPNGWDVKASRPLPHSCKRTKVEEVTTSSLNSVQVKGRSHYNAKATTCERGHSHPSKVEARVCAKVYAEFSEEIAHWGYVIYRNVRLPLWSLPPTDTGIPHYCNVDFVLFSPREETVRGFTLPWHGAIVALIDAKSGKRSRDWERGRAAVEATYGVRVEERS